MPQRRSPHIPPMPHPRSFWLTASLGLPAVNVALVFAVASAENWQVNSHLNA